MNVKYVMVDFTRGYGSSREDLKAHEDHKWVRYRGLMQTLQREHTVEFFPLACTYNGALAEDTWKEFMKCLGLDAKAQTHVLQTAAKAICSGFSTMVDIRHGSFIQPG